MSSVMRKEDDGLSKINKINSLIGVKESYQAPGALMEIIYDKERREALFRDMLPLFNYDVSKDWFHEYFQDEHADRKNKKQDFTPDSLAELITALAGGGDVTNTLDIAAGTGGLTIKAWHRDRLKHSPFDYRPSMHLYHCEELSDRALPFLLFNLAIRGMNASVMHGDVLSRRKVKGVFFVQNDYDDHLRFSSINLMPYNDAVRKVFGITTWAVEEERHKPIKETEGFPSYLTRDLSEQAEHGDGLSKSILEAII